MRRMQNNNSGAVWLSQTCNGKLRQQRVPNRHFQRAGRPQFRVGNRCWLPHSSSPSPSLFSLSSLSSCFVCARGMSGIVQYTTPMAAVRGTFKRQWAAAFFRPDFPRFCPFSVRCALYYAHSARFAWLASAAEVIHVQTECDSRPIPVICAISAIKSGFDPGASELSCLQFQPSSFIGFLEAAAFPAFGSLFSRHRRRLRRRRRVGVLRFCLLLLRRRRPRLSLSPSSAAAAVSTIEAGGCCLSLSLSQRRRRSRRRWRGKRRGSLSPSPRPSLQTPHTPLKSEGKGIISTRNAPDDGPTQRTRAGGKRAHLRR